MDELVRHCLRELSFDGDLGCDVSRLRDFIVEFYAHPSARQGQTVDDAFCAFVWSVIVQQSGVRVGTVPPGGSTEVFVAPQASAIRKAKAKREGSAEEAPAAAAATGLDVVADAACRSLEELRAQYGDQLRVAVDPETTFAALTGSHIRPSKLTPMVYTALQIITRGREKGVSVLDLGRKSGYDQKTCFYLIKQLVELGYVMKLRQPGVSTNICVHKYFYERSPVWQQVAAEEKQAVSEEQGKDEGDTDEGDSDQEETKPFAPVHFDPIDARHLSSMPVLRSRLTKLLKNCPHNMHTSNNLVCRIGFVNPTRTDRRFFRARIRELIDQGFIEKVYVPHVDRKRYADKKVPCIRLITNDETVQSQEDAMPVPDEGIEVLETGEVEDSTGLKANVSLQRQMIDRLAEAGTQGMTLNELSASLGDFDRRTVDLLINRLEKDPPPAHLADLGIAQLVETHGRERRYKYYTVAHYLALADKEGFDDPRYRDRDMSAVGAFAQVEPDAFYEDEEVLERYLASFSGSKDGMVSAKARRKAKGKAKEREPKKPKKRVNPILPDGTVKRGRPRKYARPEGEDGGAPTPSKKGRKRKREETEGEGVDAVAEVDGEEEPPPKKRRGRPPKKPVQPEEATQATPTPTKKRGRPPKQQEEVKTSSADQPDPKRRGRSRKSVTMDVSVVESHADEEDEPTGVDVEDVPMIGRSASSPLSSIPSSPVPPEVEEDEAIQAVISVIVEGSHGQVAAAEPAASPTDVVDPIAQEGPAASLRRSARIPKAKKMDNVSSPQRSVKRTRSVANVKKAAQSSQSQALNQPIAVPAESSRSGGVAPLSVLPPAPLSFYKGLQSNIPIDPALLQGDSISLLAAAQPLIAMTPEPPEQPQPGPNNAPQAYYTTSKKRDEPETSSAGPSTKRTKSSQSDGSRSKGNLSQARREKELLRLLEEADGIMAVNSKEFNAAHAALMEAITKAGETASTLPGAKIDKRTLDATFKDLETKGKIKLISTAVSTFTGASRLVRVAHLPDLPQSTVGAFMADLGQATHTPIAPLVKTIAEPVAYGGGRKQQKGRTSTAARHEQSEDEAQQVKAMDPNALFQLDDQTIRDALLSEKNTVAQLYGYIVGKAARARAMHLAAVEALESNIPSPNLVSHSSRIFHLSYFFSDIPVATYCSLVAVLHLDEELGQLLQSPEGRATPMHALPDHISRALAPTHAKARARITSLLDLLQTLELVTPLVMSESPHPAFACPPHMDHPIAFDVAPPGPYTPATAPVYWRFHDVAPIRLWILGQGLPLVWKHVPLSTSAQAATFWTELENACTDVDLPHQVLGPMVDDASALAGEATPEVVTAARTLRRAVSWSAVYSLSFLQTEYLRRHIDPATGNTPLEDAEGGEEKLVRLAWIVSASTEVVRRWFEKARKKHFRELRKLQDKKGKRRAGAHWTAEAEEAGAMVARRAAEAKQQRERDWAAMVARLHPEPLSQSAARRVERVKKKYMQGSGNAGGKWEAQVTEAIREAEMVASKLLAVARPPGFLQGPVARPALPAPVATNYQDKDVDELIASQGPRVAQNASTGKKTRKGKGKDTGEPDMKTPRRHRFLWTRDYDELVRDASVIIKARCRGPTRLEWAAMEQIFPAVPRNSVRQRLVHLKEVPGTETYLSRLEDKWYELWVQHRGTEALPDPDPESPTNFDLATHVKFLRKHIDKTAIRVGFVEVQSSQTIDLPASLEDIERHYDIMEKTSNAPQWDFMWTVVAEEAREKQFAHNAFTMEVTNIPHPPTYDDEFLHIADAAMKMALGNPNETYDADVASRFLRSVGEEPVRVTTTDLLRRGVLAKMIRDPTKMKPGRTLKISDSNQNALGGQLPRELFQDAAALDELVGQQADAAEEWQEWSLLASDGDTAFLLELVSENKVRFDVDTSHPQSMRAIIDWNSKKADDDDIETAIRVRYVDVGGARREASMPEASAQAGPSGLAEEPSMQVDEPSLLPAHGHTTDGGFAFCARASAGLVDCQACLEQAKISLLREVSEEEASAVENVLTALHEAGSAGLTKQQLLIKLDSVPGNSLAQAVRRITESPVPLAYWTGYTAIVLVAAAAIRPWTVTVSDVQDAEQRLMVFPRRWLDIYGRKLDETWEAALRAVVALVLLHPGISQAEIRWRLRTVYDRQEMLDVLQALDEEGVIIAQVDAVHRTSIGGPADEHEEKFTHWFLAESGRRWYLV